MPVGLSVVETLEEALCDAGLLTDEMESLRRVIDFAKGAFGLRWNFGPSRDRSVSIDVRQQLAQRESERPIVIWQVQVDASEEWTRRGRLMLESARRPKELGRVVTAACEELIACSRESRQTEPEGIDSPS